MEFSAQQIAELLSGEVEGDSQITVNQLAKIEEGKTGSICFLSNEAYAKYIYDNDASIIILNTGFKLEQAVKPSCTLIRVEDARLAFTKLIETYHQYTKKEPEISPNAFIDSSATIGENCSISAGVVIEANVKIGDNCVIHGGCQVLHGGQIGNNCILQSGVVIGSDGFGFAPNSENDYQKIIHLGNVIIEDNVEIGANTTIDRATLGSTIIRKGVKLDNLIQIAHNVEIGENTVIASQTGIAGSTKVGKNCMIGGQVGIIGHLTIANGVKIAAQSGIGQNIENEGEIIQGSPAFGIGEYKRSYVMFRKLPKLKQTIDRLENELNTLKEKI
ncbi:MAG: UDP-3-O-(3-hydroxymyristoyl)glucosamine N-acyltransferase [Flavobacteriales bacterium]|nr:UDP-3-O-(3-hydroxymyristoyl)glucosamine N-acyltransferase [Flavobacteriales bacterium]